jgi:hypothetical protein
MVQALFRVHCAARKREGILLHFVELAQKIRPRSGSLVRLRRRSEILHPVTGGQKYRLLQPKHLFHLLERFWDLPIAKGDLFP